MAIVKISKRNIFKRRRDGQANQGDGGSVAARSVASSSSSEFNPVILQDYAKKVGGNLFKGDQNIEGDLNVLGNINQTGQAYITYAEKVEVKNNLMQLNKGEVGSQITGVIPGTSIPFSGQEINRGNGEAYYFGVVEGAKPLFKLGKKDSLVTLAAREDSPLNNGVMLWDDANHRMKAVSAAPDSDKLGNVEAANYARTDIEETFNKKLRIATPTGWVEIGSVNESHMHFYTDRSNFYFNKEIRVDGDIETYGFTEGLLTGSGGRMTKEGVIQADSLELRKSLTVPELIISKERSINGGLVTSVANGEVKSVNGDAVTLKGEHNSFIVGDRVRLQDWNAGTRYMEAEVTAVNGLIIILGNYNTATRPKEGDSLVQWGHKDDPTRQSFLYQTSRGGGFFAVYNGVNSASLANKEVVRMGNLSNDNVGLISEYGGKRFFELSNNRKEIAGCEFDETHLWTVGWEMHHNGNFSLGKGQINYDVATNKVSFGENVTLNWGQVAGKVGGENLWAISEYDENKNHGYNTSVQNSFVLSDAIPPLYGKYAIRHDVQESTNWSTEHKYNGCDFFFKDGSPFSLDIDGDSTVGRLKRNQAYMFSAWVYISGGNGTSYANLVRESNGVVATFNNNSSSVTNIVGQWVRLFFRIKTTNDENHKARLLLYSHGSNNIATQIYWCGIQLEECEDDATEPSPYKRSNLYYGSFENVTTITKNTVTTDYIKTLDLVVGNHIQMGSEAVIAWDKVTGTDDVETTQGAQDKADTAQTAATGVANTAQKTANTAVSNASIAHDRADDAYSLAGTKVTEIEATQITKDTVTAPYVKTLGLEVGDHIQMSSAAKIEWEESTPSKIVYAKDTPFSALSHAEYVDDSNATGGKALRIWRGWAGYTYWKTHWNNIKVGSTYRIYVRCRKVGTLGSEGIKLGFYQSGQTGFGFNITDKVTEDYQVVDAGTFTPNWSQGANLIMHWLNTNSFTPNDGSGGSGLFVDYVKIVEYVPNASDITIITKDTIATTNVIAENLFVRNVKTATSGQRMEISAEYNKLEFFNSADKRVILIDDSIYTDKAGLQVFNGLIKLSADGVSLAYDTVLDATSIRTTNIRCQQIVEEIAYLSGPGTHYLGNGYSSVWINLPTDEDVYLPLTSGVRDGTVLELFTVSNYNANIRARSGALWNGSSTRSYNLNDAGNSIKFRKYGSSWYKVNIDNSGVS